MSARLILNDAAILFDQLFHRWPHLSIPRRLDETPGEHRQTPTCVHWRFHFCQTSFFLKRSTRWSQARTVMAIMVKVGFWQPLETKQAPSKTNRFLTSCAWL